jgi:general L-amino acid transport system substrate-binding protein
MKPGRVVFLIALLWAAGAAAQSPDTLATVRARGYLICGVSEGLAGFSNPDDQGNWRGIDADFCRAVAAAVFGDAQKVRYTPLSGKVRFTALQTGEVDVLARNTTFTLSRDAGLHLEFPATTYYDGQGFLVKASAKIAHATELGGASICVNQGTTTEQNIADYFRSHRMKYELVTFASSEETLAAYVAGRCDAYSTDLSGIYAQRLKLPDSAQHVTLPEMISKEPLGPAVREGDDRWADIIRWTHHAMLAGEELGLTAATLDAMKNADNPEIRRLLGTEGDLGSALGLSADWAYQILRQVGNYGEVYARDVGDGSPLKIPRGMNALYREGGLQYALPFR